jgi:HK97 gp10 family phage protein
VAKVQIRMPEDFLLKISKLGNKTDEIIPRVLDAGGKVMQKKIKSNLTASIGVGTKRPSRSTGELAQALGVSPALIDKKGDYNIKIGFSEPRKDGDSNAKIANILEYGKSGQPPKPFLRPARSSGRKPCIEAMKAKLDEELKGI